MLVTIHRGSHEIGGTCVEVVSDGTRIVIDIGKPLCGSTEAKHILYRYKYYRISRQQLKQIHTAHPEGVVTRFVEFANKS